MDSQTQWRFKSNGALQRIHAPVYGAASYSPLNLSRADEEGGTPVSYLILLNSGGKFVITAFGLGIADGNFLNLLYIPLALACWLSPVIGIIYAMTGSSDPERATMGYDPRRKAVNLLRR